MSQKKREFSKEEQDFIKTEYKKRHGAPYIAKLLGVSTGKVSYYTKKNDIVRSCSEAAKKYSFNEDFFETIDTEEKAYWLGFMYADGYVSSKNRYSDYVCITLQSKDKGHLEKFKKSLDCNVPIHDYLTTESSYKKGIPYSRITICSHKLYEDAVKQGILEHKTSILLPPHIDKTLYWHFIRGYFDGDGCLTYTRRKHRVSKNGQYIEFSIKILGTTAILDFIKECIEKESIATIRKYYQRQPWQSVRSLEVSGNSQVYNFVQHLYKNSTIYLDRKYEIYQKLCNYLHSRAIPKRIA